MGKLYYSMFAVHFKEVGSIFKTVKMHFIVVMLYHVWFMYYKDLYTTYFRITTKCIVYKQHEVQSESREITGRPDHTSTYVPDSELHGNSRSSVLLDESGTYLNLINFSMWQMINKFKSFKRPLILAINTYFFIDNKLKASWNNIMIKLSIKHFIK